MVTGAGASVTAETFYGSGAGLTDVLGATPGGGGGGETVISDDLLLSGTLEVQGASTLAGATFSTGSSFSFADDGNSISAIGISSDLGDTLASDSVLVSQKAIKDYVDGQIQETGGSITFSGDAGQESFDISDGSLTIAGTENEIVTDASAIAPNGTLKIGLSTSVSVEEDLSVGRDLSVTGLSTFLAAVEYGGSFKFGPTGQEINEVSTTLDGSSTDNQIPTSATVFSALDSVASDLSNAVLTVTKDGAGDTEVNLANGKLDFVSTANEIDIVLSAGALPSDPDTLQIGLPDDVIVTNSLTVSTANITATAGDITAGGAVSGATASVTTDLTVGATLGTNGQALLEVLSASDEVRIDGALNVSGNVDSASDLKLKENIEVIPNALEKVAALRGVSYNWKSNGELSAGIIAQEVQAVMPNIVKENESHLSVQYNGLIGLLIEGMKEQQAQIEELKSKLG